MNNTQAFYVGVVTSRNTTQTTLGFEHDYAAKHSAMSIAGTELSAGAKKVHVAIIYIEPNDFRFTRTVTEFNVYP